ncbi:MAG: hypothetical protein A2Z34_05815 [Planctomycetes bacterium RBG_16_59_8]|nr:MAG: hypothetical protein A2Z34_05815 [Planctomycetes bacterium RBG_16_59_8]
MNFRRRKPVSSGEEEIDLVPETTQVLGPLFGPCAVAKMHEYPVVAMGRGIGMGFADQTNDASLQIVQSEGLGHEVVDARLAHPIHHRPVLRRRHADDFDAADRFVGANLAADLDAVEAGEHDVEEDQVRVELMDDPSHVDPVGGRAGLVPILLDALDHDGGDLGIVIHHKDPAGFSGECRHGMIHCTSWREDFT